MIGVGKTQALPEGFVVVGVELGDNCTYTSVTNAINALDDVYRSVRAELSLLAEKGTK
ncbi:hypothetical protein TROUBLE_55 [Mycobacterium phage Trouble]|uniref:hypothetical protein n=1 Tax=Mycobacterium phage Trouble TaxID=1340825 RepID=UPI000387FAAF|nr:hypothetical protein N854_gp55 [Mycobacterium phage Trouble]AGT12569.1 hypothetical protein TROUBLE_55 [Mycobacterium phage Trouble]AXH49520.1 hypothetical protein SEA_DRFEELGOOD_50 [Mycobacterium phage DrFeelGood]